MADIFASDAIQLLKRRELVETTAGKLKGSFTGQAQANVRAEFDKAVGGVLFIDEAYDLRTRPVCEHEPACAHDL